MLGLCFIFVLLVIGVMAYAPEWRSQSFQPTQTRTSPTPLDALKERYVRGEITREEYDRVRRDLAG